MQKYLLNLSVSDEIRGPKDCCHAEQVGSRGIRCFMWEYNAVPSDGFVIMEKERIACNG